ncbi:MAG: GTP-binding protein [Eubacterium sp.]|nr:GTP-binding protein [Eubacterium sp.]
MIKTDIISGFLGAGKTTLIKKLLSGPLAGQQTVLIENEFGEIGIDGGFLKEAGIEIREMNSGCICCSLVGDFGTALKEVADTYHPDRIIIEPSGVGKLSDVIGAIQDVSEEAGIEVNSAVAVVDVTKCKIYLKNFGEFYTDQIKAAGTIILTRMDLPKATKEKADEAIALLKGINPDAVIVTTPITELDGFKLMETIEKGREDFAAKVAEEMREHHHHDDDECECHDPNCKDPSHHHHHEDGEECHCHDEEHEHHHHHDDDEDEHEHHHHHHHDDDDEEDEHEHHHHHHDDEDEDEHEHHHHHHHGHDADEIFASWGVETAHKFTKAELETILAALADEETYGTVLRAKGMVESPEGGWIYFDMVPEETDIRSGAPEITGKLCVIGAHIKEDKIKELFGV